MWACGEWSLAESIKSGNNHQSSERMYVLRIKSAQPVPTFTLSQLHTVNSKKTELLTRRLAVQTNLESLNRKVYEMCVSLTAHPAITIVLPLSKEMWPLKCYKRSNFAVSGTKIMRVGHFLGNICLPFNTSRKNLFTHSLIPLRTHLFTTLALLCLFVTWWSSCTSLQLIHFWRHFEKFQK